MPLVKQSKLRAICLYIFLATLSCNANLGASETFSVRSDSELPPLRMSYADAQRILGKAAAVAAKLNGNAFDADETLTITTGDREIAIDTHKLTSAPDVPSSADGAVYSYQARRSAPISSISVDLTNFRRSVRVSGQDAAQVDALFASLRADLLNHSVVLGGWSAQAALGMVAPIFSRRRSAYVRD